MGNRGHFIDHVIDSEGRPIASATVNVFQQGTTVNITETIFSADDPDAGTLTNPITSGVDGKVEFFLAVPKRVDLRIAKTGFTTITRTVDVDLIQVADLIPAEDGVNLIARAVMNFKDGIVATDNPAAGRTDVDASYGLVGDMAASGVTSANAAGVSLKLARTDHVHAHGDASGGAGIKHGTVQVSGTVSSAQHGTLGSGDLHPEYKGFLMHAKWGTD